MKPHLSIPEPCHEDWNQMSPEAQGRHCSTCCKVVIDFTSMSTTDVIQFISNRTSEKICGRFRSDQVNEQPVFPMKNRSVAGRAKVFLAALVLVFGSALFTGCGSRGHTVGEIAPVEQMKNMMVLDSPQTDVLIRDTLPEKAPPVKMGTVQYVDPTKENPKSPKQK